MLRAGGLLYMLVATGCAASAPLAASRAAGAAASPADAGRHGPRHGGDGDGGRARDAAVATGARAANTTPARCEVPPSPALLARTERAPPDSLLLQLAVYDTMIFVAPFPRAPALSLFRDGRVVYTPPGRERESVRTITLPREEALALTQRVADLAAPLVSYAHDCSCPGPSGVVVCTSDAGTTVLRVRGADGTLRELAAYAGQWNDRAAMKAVEGVIEDVRRRPGQPYVPDRATVYVQRHGVRPAACPAFGVAWLASLAPAEGARARRVDRSEVAQLVARFGAELPASGVCDARGATLVQIFPWLPGADRPATEFAVPER